MWVLLVDDHAMFRQGLVFLLGDLDGGLQFMEAGSCEQALELLQGNSADLILLDMNMPGKQHLDALHSLLEADPGAAIVVVSGEDDPELIRSAIRAGASGFVPKASSSEILLAALRLILAGGVYLPPSMLEQAPATRATGTSAKPAADSLSDRQLAVLLLAIQGKANKVIALDLGIAEGTVKTHLSTAYRVLGVNNRTEAVFAAARLGLKAQPD